MKRLLSGIQPSGQLHLGNYAGAIKQFAEMQNDHEVFVFVASYHALTTLKDPKQLAENIRQVAIDYIAFGLDPAKCNLYTQQAVPEVTELAWILSCICPMHLMDKGVSYKDKSAKGIASNVGLYSYPILQTADILIVNPDVVPVGKDQIQHLEIARDLAVKLNHNYGENLVKIPEYKVNAETELLPGIDGQKMSKSYGNDINPFMEEKPLRKRIMKIKTDSLGLEEPKNPKVCPVYQIFRAIAGGENERTIDLANKYKAGNYGYGHAKQDLFELLMDEFKDARQKRTELMNDQTTVEEVLKNGAEAAKEVASVTMDRIRKAVGLV